MDDLAGKLNEILNNPTEMAKFQQMANNLLGQMNTEQQNNAPEQPAQQSPQQSQSNSTGGIDLGNNQHLHKHLKRTIIHLVLCLL